MSVRTKQPVHWTSFLPDFRATLGVTRDIGIINDAAEEIEWLKTQIEAADNAIVDRCLGEYTAKEIKTARITLEKISGNSITSEVS